MLCYRDRQFCGSDCINIQCSRNITPEVERQALEWTKSFQPDADGPLMAVADMSVDCADYQPPTQ